MNYKYYKLSTLLSILNISKVQAYKWIKEGIINCEIIEGSYWIKDKELLKIFDVTKEELKKIININSVHRLYTIKETCLYSGYERRQICRMIKSGEIKTIQFKRFGQHWLNYNTLKYLKRKRREK
jgi:predicted site-specific integrase-resolvase